MDSKALSLQYIPAEGPEGLTGVLERLLEKKISNQENLPAEHYILYQLGNQKSLIKVDTSEQPFLFWYYDLLGRPATEVVKRTIAQFLWERCGEKERFFQEFQGE